MKPSIWTLLLSIFLMSCNPKAPVANIDAVISTIGDNSGTASAKVIVNFTEFLPSGDSSKAAFTFSDAGGNTMTLELGAKSGGFPTNTAYNLDGTSTTFNTTLIVTSNGVPKPIALTSTSGFINLNALERTDNQIKAVAGSFAVNFATGGTGTGTFYARAP